ncbi:MAG: hypothetical protein WAZ34_09800 [Rhodocyclaceae bacterium]
MSTKPFQLADIRFVKRIVVGNDDPKSMKTEAEVESAMEMVNRCLSGSPRGYLLNVERNFGFYHIGEHHVTLQYAAYHIAFERKPSFLD